jgi:RimJ/RimL family protein N-acetyltransferase
MMQPSPANDPTPLASASLPRVANSAFGVLQGPAPSILTSRDNTVALRAANRGDAGIFWRYSPNNLDDSHSSSIDHNKYQPIVAPSREWLEHVLEKIEQSFTLSPPPQVLWKWMVVNDQAEIVGAVDLSPVSRSGGDTFLIGVEIFPDYQRRGYARKAFESLIDWAKSTGQVREIQGLCHPDNKASSGLMEGVGMELTGRTHSAYFPCMQSPQRADMVELSIKFS